VDHPLSREFAELYSPIGRGPIPPERLVRVALAGVPFDPRRAATGRADRIWVLRWLGRGLELFVAHGIDTGYGGKIIDDPPASDRSRAGTDRAGAPGDTGRAE